MVEEHVLRPGLVVVTILASRSLRSLVRVIFFVTVAACCRRLVVEYALDVAGRALDIGVRATERVPGIDIVIKSDPCPLISDVASVAVLPEMPVMIVVIGVAGKTGRREFVRERISAVAIVTGEQRMLAGQAERRVACVVK